MILDTSLNHFFGRKGECKTHCFGGLEKEQRNLQKHGENKSSVKLNDKERLPEKNEAKREGDGSGENS